MIEISKAFDTNELFLVSHIRYIEINEWNGNIPNRFVIHINVQKKLYEINKYCI